MTGSTTFPRRLLLLAALLSVAAGWSTARQRRSVSRSPLLTRRRQTAEEDVEELRTAVQELRDELDNSVSVRRPNPPGTTAASPESSTTTTTTTTPQKRKPAVVEDPIKDDLRELWRDAKRVLPAVVTGAWREEDGDERPGEAIYNAVFVRIPVLCAAVWYTAFVFEGREWFVDLGFGSGPVLVNPLVPFAVIAVMLL